MAAGLNKVMLIGNLGQDPEMRYTPNGTPTSTFSVATNRAWTTPDGERRTETDWHNIVAWQKLAEVCDQYLRKGSRVYIEGRMRTRSWEGQDGRKNYRTEIVAQQVQFLDTRPGGSQGADEEYDEIPF